MSYNIMRVQLSIKNFIILFFIILIMYILYHNCFSYKEGIRIRRIGRAIRNAGRQVERGVNQAAEETRRAAERAAEETRRAAERAAEETRRAAERAAEEARKAAERAAAELERLNFVRAFEKLFGAFSSLENVFSRFPRQFSSLFQDAVDFKNNTIQGIRKI